VLMVGMGGKLAEVDPDVVVLVPPLSIDYVVGELSRLRAHRLLQGYRDIPPANLRALAESLLGMMAFMEDNPGEVESVEVNPVLFDGDRCVGVDAVINAYPSFTRVSAHPMRGTLVAG
jgi:hypothetical protein